MAETDGKILVEIVLDDGSVQKGFVKIRDEAKKTGSSIGDSLSSGLSSGFGSLVTRATAAGAAIGAALFSRASIEAAAQQEAAVARLNQSLASAGRFSQEASQRFQDLAENIQKTTAIGDETSLELIALATNFAKTNEQAEKLTLAAIELSAATGVDLRSAVENLGRSLSGNLGLLGKSVPSLKGFTSEQLKAGAAIDAVSNRFSGSALAAANTYEGRLAQLKNSFGDISKQIGFFVTKDKTFVAFLEGLAEGLNSISKKIASLRGQTETTRTGFGELLILLVKFAEGVNKFLIAPLELVFNFMKTGALTVLTVWNGLFAAIFAGLDKLASFLPNISVFAGLKEAIASESEDLTAKVSANFDALSASADNALNVDFAGATAVFLEDLRTKMEEAKNITGQFKNNTNGDMKEVVSELDKRKKEINTIFSAGIVNSIAAGAAYIGENLDITKFSFKEFALSIMGSLGDMSIAIGTNLIAQGVGIQALASSLASLNGAAAVAAGATLVALGSALKALSKGKGSIETGIGTQAGVGAGVGYSPIAETPVAELTPTEETLREAQTQVVVNIQGDLLDSDETSSRIISLINEAYDKKGVQIRRGVTA